MLGKIVGILLTVFFGFGVLSISYLRSASPNYAFESKPISSKSENSNLEKIEVDYNLAYPGRILPGSFLWPLKAIRDRLWLLATSNSSKKAEIMILFADKRLVAASTLFERDQHELAFATLSKGEKYLEEAWNLVKANERKGVHPDEICLKFSKVALKHREMIEEMVGYAPEAVRPEIIKTMNYSKNIYKEARDMAFSHGLTPMKNPFETD